MGRRIKIVSWNIHRCFGTDRKYQPSRVAEAINSFDADIVALQEVDSSLKGEVQNEEDQLSYLARQSKMASIMGPTLTFDYGAYGNAVLSRFPITEWEEFDLSYRRVEPRGALAVHLQISSHLTLRLVNTHLGLRYWERAFQVDRLLSQLVWREGLSSVLIGDFNEWFPFTGNRYRLEHAFSAFSPRLSTFHSLWPRLALDRAFLSGRFQELEFEVIRNDLTMRASDHLPLVAYFNLDTKDLIEEIEEVL